MFQATNRCFPYLLAAAVFFQLVSDVTAGKLISIAGFSVSASVFYFPFTFVLSDIFTEVYGYAAARRVIWTTLLLSVLSGMLFALVAWLPCPDFFDAADAYKRVFNVVPRVLLCGWLAIFLGETANNIIMAKMKIATAGRHFWLRAIASTFAGQGINTIVFYGLAFADQMPFCALVSGTLCAWGAKVAVESLCLPFTSRLVVFLKNVERADPFDTKTKLNPFLY